MEEIHGISANSECGELIGAVYLDERMVYEFPLWVVEETVSVIDMVKDIPATTKAEHAILDVVRPVCEKRLLEEPRD